MSFLQEKEEERRRFASYPNTGLQILSREESFRHFP
jgi:hypothetical protein